MLTIVFAILLVLTAFCGYKVYQNHMQRVREWVYKHNPSLVHANSRNEQFNELLSDMGATIPSHAVKVYVDRHRVHYYLFDMGREFYELSGIHQWMTAHLTLRQYGIQEPVKALKTL